MKGILKFARRLVGSIFNEREIGVSESSLFLRLNGQDVELARNDLLNVSNEVVASKVATNLEDINRKIAANTSLSQINEAQIKTKKNNDIGFILPLPTTLFTMGTDTVSLPALSFYNGSLVVNLEAQSVSFEPTEFFGKAIYIGLTLNGSPVVSTDEKDVTLLLGTSFVDADGTVRQEENVYKPYLVSGSAYNRGVQTVVQNLLFGVVTSGENKHLSNSNYSLLSEGLNYQEVLSPDKKYFNSSLAAVFKYYYPNWQYEDEKKETVIGGFFYNMTSRKKEAVPAGKIAVYRIGLVETGQFLLTLQNVSSSAQLFDTMENAQAGLDGVVWESEALSSRVINLQDFVLRDTTTGECKIVKESTVNNTINNYYNISFYGIINDVAELPLTRTDFIAKFLVEPSINAAIFLSDIINNTWEIKVIKDIEADGEIYWSTEFESYNADFLQIINNNFSLRDFSNTNLFKVLETIESPDSLQTNGLWLGTFSFGENDDRKCSIAVTKVGNSIKQEVVYFDKEGSIKRYSTDNGVTWSAWKNPTDGFLKNDLSNALTTTVDIVEGSLGYECHLVKGVNLVTMDGYNSSISFFLPEDADKVDYGQIKLILHIVNNAGGYANFVGTSFFGEVVTPNENGYYHVYFDYNPMSKKWVTGLLKENTEV